MEAFSNHSQPHKDTIELLESLSRRRKSRGVNAVVVVKSGEGDQEQTRKPEAVLTPATPAERMGLVVSEAVATAIATQSDIAERYVAAAGRLTELEYRLREVEAERDGFIQQLNERARAHERERQLLVEEFHDRVTRVEAERDLLADELRLERDRTTTEMVERVAEALSPRLCGVLDEHTGLADRYAAVVHRMGLLESELDVALAQLQTEREIREQLAGGWRRWFGFGR
jgi:DNA anti-recombination protein RmuC